MKCEHSNCNEFGTGFVLDQDGETFFMCEQHMLECIEAGGAKYDESDMESEDE